jgi:spermidine synthase
MIMSLNATAYYAGIALVSVATFLLQLALLRLFAVQQFYHFAFMAISLALLGFGASGSLLSLWQRRLSPILLCSAFGLSTLSAYLVINYLPFDSFSIAWDSRQVLYLALYFLAAAIPFLFSGLLVGGELMTAGRSGRGSHRVYGANLLGSAFGSVISLPALELFGGVGTVVLAAELGVGAGLLFLGSAEGLKGARRTVAAVALSVMLLLGLAVVLNPPAFLAQRLSPYKTLPVLSQAVDTEHILTAFDATARVDVLESGTIHVMPGLSLLSPVGPPPQAGLLVDADSLMPITGLAPDDEAARSLAAFMPIGLAYQLRPQARTLVIEAGTGMDVLLALAAGASKVTATEDTALVLEILQNEYRAFTGGLYTDPRVSVVKAAGRVFARALPPESYAVVTVALTDPHRPVTSGAYSLTENYLYTVEAFGDYVRALEPGGVLLVTRWLQTPPSESARLFATMATALRRSGREPAQHLVAFRTLRTMTVLATERPLSAGETETIREFLRTRAFDTVYLPGIQPDDVNRYQVLPEDVYHQLFMALLDDPAAIFEAYRFDIRPTTDDRPFFFHFFKWRQTPEILAGLGRTWQPFGGSGFFVLVALLLLVSLAAALFILGPLLVRALWRKVRRMPRAVSDGANPLPLWRVFLYFAALGLGFLFIEIALAQRFILVLGQPVTSLAVILFALLLFSGLGSLTVRRWNLRWSLALLVLFIAAYPLLLVPFSSLVLQWSEWVRVGLTVLVVAPLGYLMGLPFAGGLRVVEVHAPPLVPWAWAINGSFSVISAVLAVMLAFSAGFSLVLWLGAAMYALALLAFWRKGPAFGDPGLEL